MNTRSVNDISNIIGKRMAVDGQEVRRMAIIGTLAGATKAFYSANKAEQGPSETTENERSKSSRGI